MKRARINSSIGRKGVSLIELMIAMVLGLLLLGAVIQLFVGSKVTYTSNEAVARIQENGRFSMQLLQREFRDVRSRGFCGARLTIENHLNTTCSNHPDDFFAANQAVIGWDFAGTRRGDDYTLPDDPSPEGIARSQWASQLPDGSAETLPVWLQDRVVPGSDVVVLRRPQIISDITGVPGSNSETDSNITLNDPHGLDDNEIVLVTNCSTGADLFQNVGGDADTLSRVGGTCTSPGPGNAGGSGEWSAAYDDTMQLLRVEISAYFIGLSDATGEPALYRYDFRRETSEELIPGVENMQVLYGYSEPAPAGDGQSVNHWLPASEIPNWEFVIGARLALLIRSPENMGDGTTQQTFDLASTSITHQEDGRLRTPFLLSVSLRNRQLVIDM